MKKYMQLYKKIRSDIRSDIYKPNTKLPSKRTLSDLNGVSLTTVETAYEMLIDEGYIYSIEKKGYYVSEIADLKQFGNEKTDRKLEFLPLPKPNYKIEDFEYSNWFKTIRKVLNENGTVLFRKSPQKGCEVLRNAISEHLLRYRNMFVQPSNIIIGSGAEQLYETAVLLLGRDKTYGIEDPCYLKIPTVYEGMGVKTQPLKMGSDGIKTSELENKNFEVLHVTPFHSFPSGITTSIAKRTKYLLWASRSGNYIIEDDYAGEFFTKGQPIETLFSLCNDQLVIYINTFSKSLSNSMRIGYMIIPDKLIKRYNEVTRNISCTVPVLDQYILAEFISSGDFERHLARKRRIINNLSDSNIQ